MNLTSYQKLASYYEQSIEESLNNLKSKLQANVSEDEELVRRAAFFVRNGAVSISNYHPKDHQIDFVIRDVTNVEVHYLPLSDKVSCQCQMSKPCRHIVAAIFYLYQQNESLSSWISDWRSSADAVQLSLLRDERSPESWSLLVETFFRKFISNYPPASFYLLEFAVHDLKAQVKKSKPFEREWQPIFEAFINLSILTKAWPYITEYEDTNMRNRVYHFLNTSIEELDESLGQLASKPRLFAADTFYDKMMDLVHEFYFETSGLLHYRKHIYLAFWEALVTNKQARLEEVKYLQSLEREEDDMKLNMVLPYFYLTLSMTDELLTAAENMDPNHLIEWVTVCEKALQLQNKELANNLALKLLPPISYYLNHVAQNPSRIMLIRRLELLYDQVQLESKELENLYLSFGLYGIQSYSQLLLDQKRYRDWMALHQSANSSLEYAEACGLSIVKEEAPEILLPLYHHYAMRFLQEKNRYSYKQAVRVWKKMKQVAKKANETDYWNAYVENLKEKYRRLRALQQEIEKGNLPL